MEQEQSFAAFFVQCRLVQLHEERSTCRYMCHLCISSAKGFIKGNQQRSN